MSKAACKVEEDAAFLLVLGKQGQRNEDVGEFLEQPGPKRVVMKLAEGCRELNGMLSAFLLGTVPAEEGQD